MLDLTRRSRRSEAGAARARERAVRCRVCAEIVARSGDRVTIGAGELHTFVNPQGQVFELCCFARADGAAAVGEPTLEFTWFPGYAWRVALCRACAAQLGWRYESGDGARFWGLSRAALRFDDQEFL